MKGRIVGRYYHLLWIFFIVICITGCGRDEFSYDSSPIIFDDCELVTGDILLARCSGFLPAVFAGLGTPSCDYGHAGVFFKDGNGCGKILHMQPNGIAVCSLNEFREKYYKVGHVRLKSNIFIDRNRFNDECQKLLKYNNNHKILSDFWNDDKTVNYYEENKYPDSIYCLTLINMLYYRSNVPEPFIKKFNINLYPVVQLIGKALDRKEYDIPVVASIFHNSNFILIGEYSSSDKKEFVCEIDNAIVKVVNDYLKKGYVIKSAPLIKRPYLALLMGIKTIATPFLPIGTRVMVRKIDKYNELSQLYMINRFIKSIRAKVLDDITVGLENNIYRYTFAVAEEYRDIFFIKN